MKKRLIFDLVLLGAIFYTPWWVVIPLALVGAFLFPSYYEVIAFGLLVDILYGAASFPLGGIFGLIAAITIYFGVSNARKAIR